jgi:anti-sigma regulatory factor (Ser/Thr protein kinase)
MHVQQLLEVADSSQVGSARRASAALAAAAGVSERTAARLALVVTELAKNLIKHALRGHILLRPLLREGVRGVEVIALDKGPGMRDPSQCLEDGYSTAGSPGTGLGATQRAADVFEMHSVVERGSVVLAELWDEPPRRTQQVRIGVVCLPMRGEREAGDGWGAVCLQQRVQLMVCDGLGHGPAAASASAAALEAFERWQGEPPEALLQRAHGALRSTRGAAVAVADVDLEAQLVRYTGIGNISGFLIGGEKPASMASHNGIVGHECRRLQSFSYPWPPNGLLLMYSDGLTSRWKLQDYPGLKLRHPALIAATLYRDYYRGRDDVTVLVMSQGGR